MTDAATAAFLDAAGWAGAEFTALAGDASTRRYHRLRRTGETAVLMAAPSDVTLDAFIDIGARLAAIGLSTPRLLAEDRAAGLLLLEDFGDDLFASLLEAGRPAPPLFDLAVDVLIHLHRRFEATGTGELPHYDAETFLEQVMLFADIVLPEVLPAEAPETAATAFSQAWVETLPAAYDGPTSLLLRDYHVGNLVHLAGRRGIAACGLLDYQDAGLGPVAYDLVSLIEDARRDVDDALRARAVARYLAAFPNLDQAAFDASCHILALMRHFRVIGVFGRLAREQGRPDYLVHLPRLWRLVDRHLEAPAVRPLAAWLQAWLPPERRRRFAAQRR